MSGVSMCWVVGVGGRLVGAWWLQAGGIRAFKGTFSSSVMLGMSHCFLGINQQYYVVLLVSCSKALHDGFRYRTMDNLMKIT